MEIDSLPDKDWINRNILRFQESIQLNEEFKEALQKSCSDKSSFTQLEFPEKGYIKIWSKYF